VAVRRTYIPPTLRILASRERRRRRRWLEKLLAKFRRPRTPLEQAFDALEAERRRTTP
jgi:hypothetical protein